MSREKVLLPDWLRQIAEKVPEMDDWPNGKYPAVAFEARGVACADDEGDPAVILLQMVIDEVERLQSEGADAESEWTDVLYSLLDAISGPRGKSLPEDVEHAKAEVKRLKALKSLIGDDSLSQQARAWERVWYALVETGLLSFIPMPLLSPSSERAVQYVQYLAAEVKELRDKIRGLQAALAPFVAPTIE